MDGLKAILQCRDLLRDCPVLVEAEESRREPGLTNIDDQGAATVPDAFARAGMTA
jgi:hypothetical protein